MEELKKEIDRVVDQWVSEVLKRILSPETQPKKIGLWDKFKRGLTNLFYGDDYQKNPYYWQNRLGRMGMKESHGSPLTLSEYSGIKSILDEAEMLLENTNETEQLQLVKIIRSAAAELKRMLYGIFSKPVQRPMSTPAAAAPKTSAEPAAANSSEPSPSKIDEPPAAKAVSEKVPEEAQRSSRSHAAKSVGWFDEALKAKNEDPSKTKPSAEWFDKNKVLRPEKIPFVLAWMSHRTDKTDDEHIVNALRAELNDNSLEILPEGKRNVGLLKYLKQSWFKMSDESLLSQLSKLGVEIRPKEKVEKTKPEQKTSSETKPKETGEKTKTDGQKASSETKPEETGEKAKPEQETSSETKPKAVSADDEKTNSSSDEKSTGRVEPETQPKREPVLEKGSEQEIISRLYSRDGRLLKREDVKEITKRELINHLLDDLKGNKAPPGSHDRLSQWWRDNYEQSTDLDIVLELKSGNFLNSVLETILPRPQDKNELDAHKKKIEKYKKIILDDLSNRT
jgi:hypothetical protein